MEVASHYKLLAHCLQCLVFTLLFKLPNYFNSSYCLVFLPFKLFAKLLKQ